ncbi:hypothetical protein VP01_1503g5 [Puccinia sorghi]|uniref:Uncharacterized protein n=1 Tax=Puccinia sorghi TaxID=27349 RepID=A0A0L6VJ09_9BASI|nr:hypothetical protein VP01_1503g5 [Puccinia sorghi]
MAPHRQSRRLCLCSKCAQSTHKSNGQRRTGKLLTFHTVYRHQLQDRVAHPARNLSVSSETDHNPPWPSSPANIPWQFTVVPGPSQSSLPLGTSASQPSALHIMVSAAVLHLVEHVPARVTFTCASNLRALLESENLPPSLSSLANKVIGTNPAGTNTPSTTLNRLSYQPFLPDHVFQLLIDQINSLGCPCHIPSDRYHHLSLAEQNIYHPITAKYTPLKHHCHGGIVYSTLQANPRNSFVKLDAAFPDSQQFGVIESIFQHSYCTTDQAQNTFVWFVVKPLAPLHAESKNPFRNIRSPAMQVDLRLPPSQDPIDTILVQVRSIESLCAWIKYKYGKAHASLTAPTIGLVSLNRD